MQADIGNRLRAWAVAYIGDRYRHSGNPYLRGWKGSS